MAIDLASSDTLITTRRLDFFWYHHHHHHHYFKDDNNDNKDDDDKDDLMTTIESVKNTKHCTVHFFSAGGIIWKHVVWIKIKKERKNKMVNCMVCSRYAVKEGKKSYSFLFLVFVFSSHFVFVVANSIFVRRSIFNVNILKLCCRNEKNTGTVLKNRRRGNTSKHRMMYVGSVMH